MVANGCTDDTAERARATGAASTVVELDRPSKRHALRAGAVLARSEVRVLVDADVVISGDHLQRLVDAVDGEVMVAVPARVLAPSGSPLVDAYHRISEKLPSVEAGMFGRGVIALSAAGWERISELPEMMSDDLVISEAFAPHQRRVVPATSVRIQPPTNVRDLIRRRTRVVTGVRQADDHQLRGASTATSPRDLLRLAMRKPTSVPDVAVFVAITIAARWAARTAIRRGDYQTWLRDESSRT